MFPIRNGLSIGSISQIKFDASWEGRVVERILHNLSLLFDRSFSTVQELNKYRKELAREREALMVASPLPGAA